MTRNGNGNLEKLIFTANTKDHNFVSFFVLLYLFLFYLFLDVGYVKSLFIPGH